MPEPAKLTAAHVAAVKFDRARRRQVGYDMGQVDAFVERVSARMFAMEAEIAQLHDQLEAAAELPPAEVAVVAEVEPDVRVDVEARPASDTLTASASAAAADIVREAAAAATAQLVAAEEDAERIVARARASSAELAAQAREEAAALVAEAETERDRLVRANSVLASTRDGLKAALLSASEDVAVVVAELDADPAPAGADLAGEGRPGVAG